MTAHVASMATIAPPAANVIGSATRGRALRLHPEEMPGFGLTFGVCEGRRAAGPPALATDTP